MAISVPLPELCGKIRARVKTGHRGANALGDRVLEPDHRTHTVWLSEPARSTPPGMTVASRRCVQA